MKNTFRLFFLIACLLMVGNSVLAQDNNEELIELLAEYIGADEPGVVAYVA